MSTEKTAWGYKMVVRPFEGDSKLGTMEIMAHIQAKGIKIFWSSAPSPPVIKPAEARVWSTALLALVNTAEEKRKALG